MAFENEQLRAQLSSAQVIHRRIESMHGRDTQISTLLKR